MEKWVCPRCRGTDIELDAGDFKSFGIGAPSVYRCKNCGLTSPVFPIMDEETAKDFKKEKIEFLSEEEIKETEKKKTPPYWLYLAAGLLLLLAVSPILGAIIILYTIALYVWREILKK